MRTGLPISPYEPAHEESRAHRWEASARRLRDHDVAEVDRLAGLGVEIAAVEPVRGAGDQVAERHEAVLLVRSASRCATSTAMLRQASTST